MRQVLSLALFHQRLHDGFADASSGACLIRVHKNQMPPSRAPGRFWRKNAEVSYHARMPWKADWWICKPALPIVGLACLALGLSACNQRSEGQANADRPAVDVEVIHPARVEVPRRVRMTGSLFGQEQATVAAKVSGRVQEIAKDVGDEAKPGDLVLRLDPTDFKLERDERKLALAQALAELGLQDMPAEGFDVNTLPAVDRARLQALNADARYERGRELFQQDPPLISEKDYADLQTARDVAVADQRVAVLVAEAMLAAARTLEAQLRIAEQQLAETEHIVPRGTITTSGAAANESDHTLSYVVSARMVSIGDLVQVGAPLFRLVDPDPIKLRAAVPERRAASIRVGQQAMVSTEARPISVPGRVSRINPAINPQTRTFEVEIIVPNADRALTPGAFARADVEIDRQAGVLVVPIESLSTFAGVTKLLIEKDGKLLDRPITVGERFASVVEVTAGLAGDEMIVRRPTPSMTGGIPARATQAQWTPEVSREAPAATTPTTTPPAGGGQS